MVSNTIDIFISNGEKERNYFSSSLSEANCLMNTQIYAFRHSQTAHFTLSLLQGGSNMTGTDFYVNKPHCAAAVRP